MGTNCRQSPGKYPNLGRSLLDAHSLPAASGSAPSARRIALNSNCAFQDIALPAGIRPSIPTRQHQLAYEPTAVGHSDGLRGALDRGRP